LNFDAAKETVVLCQNARGNDSGGFRVTAHAVDVRNENEVDKFVTDVANTHGRIDVFVDTAGLSLLSVPDMVWHDI